MPEPGILPGARDQIKNKKQETELSLKFRTGAGGIISHLRGRSGSGTLVRY